MSWLGNIFGIGTGDNSGGAFHAAGPDQAQLANAQNLSNQDIAQQQAFVNQTMGQNGLGNQASVFAQQQALANQLQGVANGTSRANPAQAALNQATGQNVATQASLMAGQRGANQNVGLLARQIANQGAQTQQQAVGQSATMQAQQQLAGMNALQQQQASMGNLAANQVGQQQASLAGLNQAAAGNQGNVMGLQANANTVNAQIAQANQKASAGLVGGILGGVGNATMPNEAHGGMIHKMADGGQVTNFFPNGHPVNQDGPRSLLGQMLAQPQAQAAPAQSGQNQTGQMLGNFARQGAQKFFANRAPQAPTVSVQDQALRDSAVTNTLPQADQALRDSAGVTTTPQVELANQAATTGETAASTAEGAASAAEGATAAAEGAEGTAEAAEAFMALLNKGGRVQHLGSGGIAIHPPEANGDGNSKPDAGIEFNPFEVIKSTFSAAMSRGGNVPAMVSPGEIYLSPEEASSPEKAAKSAKKKEMKGEKIPGKAKVKGDSLKNDTVSKNLEEGGIVIPRSHSEDPNLAASFAYQVAMHNRTRRK